MAIRFRSVIILGSTLIGCAFSLPAAAQEQAYQCVNESIQIDIEKQPMSSAIEELSEQTNCPISVDGSVDGATSQPVSGMYTPEQALMALVRGTGLTGRSIRQGLNVTGSVQASSQTEIPYNCQNESIRLDVPEMRLDRALEVLSRQTLCPISRDFEVGGLVSRPIRGNYTPLAALRTMLKGTGLRGKSIKQGLEILPVR